MAIPKHPYTVKQVAEMYGYTEDGIRNEIKVGRLHASHKKGQSKKWYITEKDLRKWTEEMLEA